MIVREIAWRSPLDAFAPLAGEPFACLLHAGEGAVRPGWSVIAAFPASRLEVRRGAAVIDGRPAAGRGLDALAALHASRRPASAAARDPGAPFHTGLAGFVGYEFGAEIEPAAEGPRSPFALPDLAFGAYDASAAFDRAGRRTFILARNDSAADRLKEALGTADQGASKAARFSPVRSDFEPAAYRAAVARAIGLIAEGAFFQVNLSQILSMQSLTPIDAFSIFRRLALGDAPFGAFLSYADGSILSNSPERFFRIAMTGGAPKILAEPIKGTRPRGRTPREDADLAADLLGDPKERAENVMIADLARNDLSRICKDGSIAEDEICALVSHASVHHLVSRISGELRRGVTPVDALDALFPCGSITGAPKIEAMKTIAALEGRGRGPYCGAIGYIDDRGNADFSVAIRLMIAEKKERHLKVAIPVGGGITLRSDPQAEYLETMVKARAALDALGIDASAP